jgi:hypothetical protein
MATPGNDAPSPAITGSCLCGAVRFRIIGPLGPVVYCHCSQCRRASGSAFAANAAVRRSDIVFLSGRDGVREYESSAAEYRAFCSGCGSPVFSRVAADAEHVRVRLGTLEQDPGRRAVAHVWVGSKAPWFEITDGLPQYATGAPHAG